MYHPQITLITRNGTERANRSGVWNQIPICKFESVKSAADIMKTLFLLRHAKAENLTPGSTDLERTLKEAGRRQAKGLGTLLKQQNLTLDLVLCSTAVRAQETTELLLASAEATVAAHYDQAIYEAGPTILLQLISQIEDSANTVLVVGHNPGMEELVQLLTNRAEQMSTCTLAKITFETNDWNEVTPGNGTLEQLVRP